MAHSLIFPPSPLARSRHGHLLRHHRCLWDYIYTSIWSSPSPLKTFRRHLDICLNLLFKVPETLSMSFDPTEGSPLDLRGSHQHCVRSDWAWQKLVWSSFKIPTSNLFAKTTKATVIWKHARATEEAPWPGGSGMCLHKRPTCKCSWFFASLISWLTHFAFTGLQ